jgi:hypothetical protein
MCHACLPPEDGCPWAAGGTLQAVMRAVHCQVIANMQHKERRIEDSMTLSCHLIAIRLLTFPLLSIRLLTFPLLSIRLLTFLKNIKTA